MNIHIERTRVYIFNQALQKSFSLGVDNDFVASTNDASVNQTLKGMTP